MGSCFASERTKKYIWLSSFNWYQLVYALKQSEATLQTILGDTVVPNKNPRSAQEWTGPVQATHKRRLELIDERKWRRLALECSDNLDTRHYLGVFGHQVGQENMHLVKAFGLSCAQVHWLCNMPVALVGKDGIVTEYVGLLGTSIWYDLKGTCLEKNNSTAVGLSSMRTACGANLAQQ